MVPGDPAADGLALALVLSTRDVLLTPDWLGACARAYADSSGWADHLISPLRAAHVARLHAAGRFARRSRQRGDQAAWFVSKVIAGLTS